MTVVPMEDVIGVRALHDRMEMPYSFPLNGNPLFFVRMAAVDANGAMVGACAVKLVGEAFLWCDPKRDQVLQVRAISALQEAAASEAAAKGLEEVSCWIPPAVEGKFARLLERLGWLRSPWQNWTKVL